MADLFWLSDEQWVVIEPFMPRDQPDPSGKTTGRLSPASCTCSRPAAAGAIASRVQPAHHGLQPLQSLVAARLLEGDADRAGQAGWVAMQRLSTAATSGLTGLPMAGKGGKGAGHWPIARWSNDDQDPRTHRCPWPTRRPPADVGQRQRRDDCPSGVGRGARPDPPPECRQGLRRRLAAHRPAQERHHARHPGQTRPQTLDPP